MRTIVHPGKTSRALACALLLASGCDSTGPDVAVTTGGVRVTVAMTGADLPATYDVLIGGRTTTANQDSATTMSGLLPGAHNVLLGVTSNCQVAGDNPRVTTVVAGEITSVEFSVTCAASVGVVRVTTATAGIDIDPNGYLVSIDGFSVGGTPHQQTVSIATTGTVTVAGVPGGNVRVTLSGLSVDCNAASANPRTVTVAPADTAVVAFDVTCAAATSQLAYVAVSALGRDDIHLIGLDGSGAWQLTTDPSSEDDPAWSPDGRKIAFTTDRDANREIYAMEADGSTMVRLTNEPRADYHPVWSPDGLRIAFVSERDGDADIYLMNADGTNVVRLTNSVGRDADPAWSPDGRRIAYTSERQGAADVFVMVADGSSPVRFTVGGGRHPAWSPDGTTLAYSTAVCSWYTYSCQPAIFLKTTTGDRVEHLALAVGERPAWSADGRKLAYDAFQCDFYAITCEAIGIQIVRVDGTDVVGWVSGHSPVWRP